MHVQGDIDWEIQWSLVTTRLSGVQKIIVNLFNCPLKSITKVEELIGKSSNIIQWQIVSSNLPPHASIYQ